MPEFGEPRPLPAEYGSEPVLVLFEPGWNPAGSGPKSRKRETCIDHKYGIKVNPHALSVYGHTTRGYIDLLLHLSRSLPKTKDKLEEGLYLLELP